MAAYTGKDGRTYTVGAEIQTGGEGTVYHVQGDENIVAKIYRKDHFKTDDARETTHRKLKTMIRMSVPKKPAGLRLEMMWPQDILYDNTGKMVGFIMPKIRTKYRIYDLYRMTTVAEIYPGYTWKYSVQIAFNMASAIRFLHEKNIVIGDMNPDNIAFDVETSAVVLIDCDSFDITDPLTGEHFPCVAGLPEILAPELQIPDLTRGQFSKESDDFSLAIHIFRFLMKNTDPFGCKIDDGVGIPSRSKIVANEAIVKGYCPYVRNLSVFHRGIPPYAPPYELLPPEIRELFKRTFNYTERTAIAKKQNRATAREWATALYKYAAPGDNKNLTTCSVNPKHVYPVHNKVCPWCNC